MVAGAAGGEGGEDVPVPVNLPLFDAFGGGGHSAIVYGIRIAMYGTFVARSMDMGGDVADVRTLSSYSSAFLLRTSSVLFSPQRVHGTIAIRVPHRGLKGIASMAHGAAVSAANPDVSFAATDPHWEVVHGKGELKERGRICPPIMSHGRGPSLPLRLTL